MQALNASKDQLLSIIADNLRTPFTVLIGISNMIVRNITTVSREQMKESAISLHDAAESVYMLLENLLAWAQLQQGILDYQPQSCSISEIVEHNIYFFAARAEQKQMLFKNQVSKEIRVTCDRIMLNIIVRNLMSNSLKFSKPGGVISISTYTGGSYLDIIVSDTGVASRWELPKLFRIDSKYSQLVTDGEEGTGLGLLFKALAERDRAKVRVESELNQGTVVRTIFRHSASIIDFITFPTDTDPVHSRGKMTGDSSIAIIIDKGRIRLRVIAETGQVWRRPEGEMNGAGEVAFEDRPFRSSLTGLAIGTAGAKIWCRDDGDV